MYMSFKNYISLLLLSGLISTPGYLFSQKPITGNSTIKAGDLESHVSFLASPYLKGRANGEPELNIAMNYIATQAKLIGLLPANGSSYYQPYYVLRKSVDPEKTCITISAENGEPVVIRESPVQLFPAGGSDFESEGDVVFAGYGIKADKYNYNDFENLDPEGKIILIMNRSPLSADGKQLLFIEPAWSAFMGLQAKLTTLMFTKAKIILIVPDPKSGFTSIDQQYSAVSEQLKSIKYLKGSKPPMAEMPGMPRIMFVTRTVADELLKGTGFTLEELQLDIDSNLKSHSFPVTGKKLKVTEVSITDEITLNNVAGYIEGSDPVLKNEFVIFSGHADHIGSSGEFINPGADDDASGSAALLELAEAFQSLDKKPLRSLLFLWVSGEEIGLFGSQSYVDHPLVPLENSVADINMDMIGREKGEADTTSETPMTGPESVFIITGDQSSDLLTIAEEADRDSPLTFDHSLSGRNGPLQLFRRSDHYNFVRKDIPVLFFTTGLHSDYHSPRDVVEKIDFGKMELIIRTIYDIGFNIANRKTRLVVNNPFSKW
jgi:hypothetical protein